MDGRYAPVHAPVTPNVASFRSRKEATGMAT